MAVIYREGVVGDIPAVVDLCNNHGSYDEVDEQVVRTGGTWYVAENNGVLIGCVWFITDRQHASIDYLAIHEDHQSLDNYRQVMDRLKDFLQNQYGTGYYHGLIELPDGSWVKMSGDSYAPLGVDPRAFYEQRGLVDDK